MKFSTRLHLFSFLLTALLILSAIRVPLILAQSPTVFSTEELAKFNGKSGQKAYYAYEGKVYDVTGSRLWKEGEHFGLQAGTDLTGKMGDAPHGTDVFAGFSVVGTYATKASSTPLTPVVETTEAQPTVTSQDTKAWYEGRIRILNISMLGWTGIFLGVFFVLNFATCFALPWSKLSLPWKGSRPGLDPLDQVPTHLKWSSVHKYFAWLTVVFGLIHGVLGLLQLLGFYL